MHVCIDLLIMINVMLLIFYSIDFLSILISASNGNGLLLLYRPRDISNDCAFSQRLKYGLSYGMGMSDTITLVLRTLTEVDYECGIEIITEYFMMLIVVVKYPNSIGNNCAANQDAFTVLKKNKCIRLCDSIGDRDPLSPYFVFVVQGKVRLRFVSNSSINSDINANMYQITATAARRRPTKDVCMKKNETQCSVGHENYCFTSGVVCDGIVNCGVVDWFDERKSTCGLPVERLGIAPVIAVIAAMLCVILAAGHILLRCLPPLASSFFIFNANEDNRLCIDPVLKPAGDVNNIEISHGSPIPDSYSNSTNSGIKYDPRQSIFKQFTILEDPMESIDVDIEENVMTETETETKRSSVIRFVSKILHNTFHSVSSS